MSGERWGRGLRPVTVLVLGLCLAGCSGGGGGGSPSEPEVLGNLGINATVFAVDRTGLRKITILLDGEDVGDFIGNDLLVAPTVTGSKLGVRPGKHQVKVRIDDMSVSPAKVGVALVLIYSSPAAQGPNYIDAGSQTKTVRRGDSFVFNVDVEP